MIKVISFADSFKHFDKAIKEYEKRLTKKIDFKKLKPVKGEPNMIVKKESEELKKVLEKEKGYKVLLFIDSKEISTPQMAKMIEEKEMQFWNVVFIIWGAYWVDFEIIKDQIDLKMSLSPMTFPHIMAILILLEQLYRCFEIRKGSWYHH